VNSGKAVFEAELLELKELLADTHYRYKKLVREKIARTERVLQIIARDIG
jgi:hypothetical protein